MPWFGDFGILYYRTDLLKKYGYKAPPKTWADLFTMAKKIQDGERATNPNFTGFVFQGNAYEGLTCNALEWIASAGGGNIIDNGKVTIDNTKARTVLDLMRSPDRHGHTSWRDLLPGGQTEHAFDTGNAAFMRNWPYAYGVAQRPARVKGKFAVDRRSRTGRRARPSAPSAAGRSLSRSTRSTRMRRSSSSGT